MQKLSHSLTIDEINRRLLFQKEDFPDLHLAAKNESLVLFLGAGISRLYGCPLWYELAIELIKKLNKREKITFAQKDILEKEAIYNPRKVITICYELCKSIHCMKIYEQGVKESLSNINIENCKEIYRKIFSLNALVHLTTNIDLGVKTFLSLNQNAYRMIKFFDCTSDYDRHRIEQLSYNIFKDGNLLFLHGTCENIQNIVLAVDKYLSFYSENIKFLDKIFSEIINTNSILIFIGYGLSEWDVIEKIYKIKKLSKEITSYLLSPIYSHEITKFNLEMNYYKAFGVEPIPYIIDNEGYEKLFFVLDNLAKAISSSTQSPYVKLLEIDEI